MTRVKLSFKKPEHGWLPTTLEVKEKNIEFDASDVPNNPVEQLIYSLSRALDGLRSTVWWHLEPAGYYFHFQPEVGQLRFSVTFSEDSNELDQKEIVSIICSPKDVLLPFWRALQTFASYNSSEPHWSETSTDKLASLGKRIKSL